MQDPTIQAWAARTVHWRDCAAAEAEVLSWRNIVSVPAARLEVPDEKAIRSICRAVQQSCPSTVKLCRLCTLYRQSARAAQHTESALTPQKLPHPARFCKAGSCLCHSSVCCHTLGA
eukprot:1144077-Pelagomonas_calceolata.AAC.5